MEPKKIFWVLYSTTDLAIGFLAPLAWWLPLSVINLAACWWVAFRSGWF